jgi:hypothetical protein
LIEPFSEKYVNKLMKKLIGNNEIEDALKRLDRLTQEEARMATAQLLRITNAIADNVLLQDLRRWISPPNPSTNHNIACNAHHKGTATWFIEGRTYKGWKSTASESLLWIHGKRTPLPHSAAWRHLIVILICSWLRQEYTLVSRAVAFSVKDN